LKESVGLFSSQHENILFDIKKGTLRPIEADSNRIQQVLNNLLLNAIDACDQVKKPAINFETKTTKINSGKYCQITINDNGQGFDEDIINNAFEPYQTSKEHGKGLGLAIVKSIIDEHKGEINIDNTNVGASIKIILPIEQKNLGRTFSE
jgi:Signal transduction histidine kinase involved in nitrogen fixation and metabolism regulation